MLRTLCSLVMLGIAGTQGYVYGSDVEDFHKAIREADVSQIDTILSKSEDPITLVFMLGETGKTTFSLVFDAEIAGHTELAKKKDEVITKILQFIDEPNHTDILQSGISSSESFEKLHTAILNAEPQQVDQILNRQGRFTDNFISTPDQEGKTALQRVFNIQDEQKKMHILSIVLGHVKQVETLDQSVLQEAISHSQQVYGEVLQRRFDLLNPEAGRETIPAGSTQTGQDVQRPTPVPRSDAVVKTRSQAGTWRRPGYID